MRQLFLAVAILVITGITGTAAMAAKGDDKAVTFEQLPQVAQQFINQHFAKGDITYAKVDTDLMDKDYEVMFKDGSKIEFTKKGEWKEVKCKASAVPTNIIPQKIKDYISKTHATETILEISRDSREYEVKLSNKMELKFNLKGDFIRYDS